MLISGTRPVSFTAADCNNKLIGARYFNATWKLAVSLGLVKSWSGDYVDSPRDADGHGTHTLSTAGGNESTDVSVSGSAFTISGIAPRARVAAYKVCYVPADANDVPQQGSCYNSDSVAAIDQAVADGVDVINFSIGGSRTSFRDAVQTAFANASINGVFVSASAGNSGPGNTVAHVSPWLMTVGNSTHDRYTEATVTLGNGATAQGASFQTAGLPLAPRVWSRDAGFAAGQAFAAGTNGTILHYNGSTWSSMTSGTTEWVNGIWGTSASNVFAVGGNGTILHYNGTSWSSMVNPATASLTGIWGTSGSNIIALGLRGTILHYNGTSWSFMDSGTTRWLLGVWGSSGSDIFAVGEYGHIFHYNGSDWSLMTIMTSSQLVGVWGSSGNNVFAVGTDSVILNYNGSYWNPMASGTSATFQDVWGSSGSDVYVAGGAGGITKLLEEVTSLEELLKTTVRDD